MKKVISILLSIILLVGCFPLAGFAESQNPISCTLNQIYRDLLSNYNNSLDTSKTNKSLCASVIISEKTVKVCLDTAATLACTFIPVCGEIKWASYAFSRSIDMAEMCIYQSIINTAELYIAKGKELCDRGISTYNSKYRGNSTDPDVSYSILCDIMSGIAYINYGNGYYLTIMNSFLEEHKNEALYLTKNTAHSAISAVLGNLNIDEVAKTYPKLAKILKRTKNLNDIREALTLTDWKALILILSDRFNSQGGRDYLSAKVNTIVNTVKGLYNSKIESGNTVVDNVIQQCSMSNLSTSEASSKATSEFDPIWPCKNSFIVTCLYYYKTGNKHGSRYGNISAIDISGSKGESILAIEDGTVETVANQGASSFGKYVVIRHSNGSRSLYGHLNSYTVSKGQSVNQGQQIGTMGTTGNSTGVHLHLEIEDFDPWKDFYNAKYYSNIIFEQNVRSNNESFNTDKTIVNIIDSSYSKKGTYYYYNGVKPNVSYVSYSVVHTPGTYQVYNVNSYLNIRSTPATSSNNYIGKLYCNDTVQLTEFSGNWGKCDKGWVSMNYMTYVGPLEPEIKQPVAPSIRLATASDQATGSIITAVWDSVQDADCYDVYLKNTHGTVIKELTSISVTNANFMINEGDGGEYYITAYARNSKYTSACSNTLTVREYDPLTVKFLDWDGSVKSEQTVRYGENAVIPPSPSRYGFTFKGWRGTYSNVKTNQTCVATYERNRYTVRFFDDNGKLISTSNVLYESAATAPSFTPNDGYKEGWCWDKDFDYIERDTDVTAVVNWYDDDMSCIVTNLKAVRNTDGLGVTVSYNVSNQKGAITSARAIVSLKTSEGRLVTTTESAAFAIKNNVTKSQEQFIPTTEAASYAEVYIVANYKTAIPVSLTQSVVVDQGSENWSDWSEIYPSGSNVYEIQSRTEYRYSEKTYSTESYPSKNGWTLYDKKITSYGTTQGPVYSNPADGLRKTWEENYIYDYEKRTVYNYSRYVNYSGSIGKTYNNGARCFGYSSGYCTYYQETGWLDSPLHDSGSSNSSSNGRCYGGASSTYDSQGLYWFNQVTKQVNGNPLYATRWYYQEPVYTYYFWKWNDWSSWSANEVSSTDNKKVETRTVYRYRTNELVGIENTDGIERTLTGTVDSSFGGKTALLMIYKVDEASDYSNQYVKQFQIDEDGSYSVTYKLLSEPTVGSGDYTVTLGIAGTKNVLYVDTIEAPKPEYTVTFYDDEGNVICTQVVEEGENAIVPKAPEKEGYRFIFWDHTGTNIKDNTDIYAHYEKKTYTVVFVNWTEETVNIQSYEHGDTLVPPTLNDTDDSTLIGWDVAIDKNTIVTDNMLITAKYEKKSFSVKFLDYDNNVISEQTVEYGESAVIPTALEEEDYCFFRWNSATDLENVTSDTVVVPSFEYVNTVNTPIVSVKNGSYSDAQQVSIACDTENAVIYYTLDGSDPDKDTAIEYTGPFTISSTTELRVIACAFHQNDSEEVDRYVAINGSTNLSDYLEFSEIPSFVLNNLKQYSVYEEIGYRYKDTITTNNENSVKELTANGWAEESRVANDWSEWSRNYPDVSGFAVAEVETKSAEPILAKVYTYTRYKCTSDSGIVYYSGSAIPNVNGELETLKLSYRLPIVAFDGENSVFSYQNSEWFNQVVSLEEVVPDFSLYRYRTYDVTYCKWGNWTTSAHDSTETRDCECKTVYRYKCPNQYIVSVVSSLEENTKYYFNNADTPVSFDISNYEIFGYTLDGVYIDREYSKEWNLSSDSITRDTTLYFKYSPIEYTVTIVGVDEKVIDTQKVKYLDYAEIPEFPTESGYVFFGVNNADCLITGDTTIKGIYVKENEITRISLDKKSINLYENTSTKISASITSSSEVSESISWCSLNPYVAEVDDDGNIHALSSGTATIMVTCGSYCYAAYCDVEVSADPNETITLKSTSLMRIDEANQLRGVPIGENTVAEIKSQILSSGVQFFDKSGNEMNDDDLVGTNTVICISGDNDSVKCVMTGDTNGDGKVNNRDVAYLTRYLVDKEVADLPQLTSMDVNGDGKVNNRDAAMLARYLVGKESI